MNDSEVTMHDTRPPGDLTVYRTALEAAAAAIALVRKVPAPLKSLADQVIRSASCVGARYGDLTNSVRTPSPQHR
jgi:formylmethanofuran:tetrahydromethanopterin formyltransferase